MARSDNLQLVEDAVIARLPPGSKVALILGTDGRINVSSYVPKRMTPSFNIPVDLIDDEAVAIPALLADMILPDRW